MEFQRLREQMVGQQILARGIMDAHVIAAMRRVPRHLFVPKDMVSRAYEDCAVPIGEGQTISQPYMVALMTQCLMLNKDKRVLEIGTGSGYQAAVLAELSREVYTIERIEGLLKQARRTLHNLKYTNIRSFVGDGNFGLEDNDLLFDAIIITAASKKPPDRLLAQLAVNGKMVVPMGDRFSQSLMVFTKNEDRITEESVCHCTFVPLIGEYGWPLN
jgi:protein-L-isoaspartate(D-aspartate) O-methyltransferase